MQLKNFSSVLNVVGLSLLFYVLHLALFHFFIFENIAAFHYELYMLYLFFGSCALIIVFILSVVRQKNIDNVGNAFMLLTCIKMLLAYILLHPILQDPPENAKVEKINFFVTFALFLIMETVVTIRLLNKK